MALQALSSSNKVGKTASKCCKVPQSRVFERGTASKLPRNHGFKGGSESRMTSPPSLPGLQDTRGRHQIEGGLARTAKRRL